MAETTSFGCGDCAYFLEEENGEEVCACPESAFVGKERDPSNSCDYFLETTDKEKEQFERD